MPTATKQLTADEVLERLNAIHEFSEQHPEEWRNEIARDMNHLVGRAVWWVETDRHDIDTLFGAAVLRIVERVAEFEEIKAKGKPNE
jgi:predicted thioredoxin/glutaredoxin